MQKWTFFLTFQIKIYKLESLYDFLHVMKKTHVCNSTWEISACSIFFQGDGQTALHIASAEGDETLVKYFYGVRASASITDHQDRTPMHLAAENGHASIIELLADKFKASIFERTKDGSTLMHIASLNGHSECATMLFKKGVYLHMPNKRGARSIHTAAKYGHVGIISTLLQRGEKVSYLSLYETDFLSANIWIPSTYSSILNSIY